MPKPSAHFKKGDRVGIFCYKEDCENGSPIPVTLGNEYEIHPDFIKTGGVGRFSWGQKSAGKGFELGKNSGGSGYCRCPLCDTAFGGVIVILDEEQKTPIIFGYDPGPE